MRALVLVTLLAACSAYDENLGPAPFLCGPSEPRCPAGYECRHDAASNEDVCGKLPAFACADDSAFEPNDTPATASTTPVDAMTGFTQPGLAICPTGDVDTFAIDLGAMGRNVALTVAFDARGAVLRGAILNQGGVP